MNLIDCHVADFKDEAILDQFEPRLANTIVEVSSLYTIPLRSLASNILYASWNPVLFRNYRKTNVVWSMVDRILLFSNKGY